MVGGSVGTQPELFTRAIRGLRSVQPRQEILLEEIPAPQRLAPYAFALGASVLRGSGEDAEEIATGRLVLLHDPAGQDAWDGTMRVVTYVTAELDPEMSTDPLLADVGWSWLIEALDENGAHYTAAGGTVTRTTSTRYGDLAGPPEASDVELRASWTVLDGDGSGRVSDPHSGADIAAHLEAWCALLASTAGLPPPGVSRLGRTAP